MGKGNRGASAQGDDADDNSGLGEEEENEEESADVGWEPWKPQGRTSLPQPLLL